MVAQERHRHEVVEELEISAQRVCQLEEVAVVQRTGNRLPEFVLGDGVHAGLRDERRVVAVDDLAENPALRMPRARTLSVTARQNGVGAA